MYGITKQKMKLFQQKLLGLVIQFKFFVHCRHWQSQDSIADLNAILIIWHSRVFQNEGRNLSKIGARLGRLGFQWDWTLKVTRWRPMKGNFADESTCIKWAGTANKDMRDIYRKLLTLWTGHRRNYFARRGFLERKRLNDLLGSNSWQIFLVSSKF